MPKITIQYTSSTLTSSKIQKPSKMDIFDDRVNRFKGVLEKTRMGLGQHGTFL